MKEPIRTQAVINGKVYNTEDSTIIAEHKTGYVSIYKTNKGNYFGVVNQDESKVIRALMKTWVRLHGLNLNKQSILPMTKQNVIDYMLDNELFDELKDEFPDQDFEA